jgi:linoleoyl-CoA desaturase
MSQKESATLAIEPLKKLKFAENTGFQIELTRRVDRLFQATGLRERDCPQMYLKTIILLLSLLAAYFSLVFLAQTWWQALILSFVLGLVMVGIGFNVQHDGSHNAYSNFPWVNKLMAMTLDLIGLSSYYWKWGHTVLHHKYPNIAGYDPDVDLGILARKSPYQQLLPHHRWQPYYIWLIYGSYIIEWSFIHDFQNLLTGKFYEDDYPRPKGVNLAIFLIGKGIFLTLAFGIPLMFHSVWNVLTCYIVAEFTMGIVRMVPCSLAHEVEGTTFPLPLESTGAIEQEWAIHQIETTVNFPCSRFLTWFLGGLNFQIEHHLFPNICHVNYPAIAQVVEQTCQEYGIKYKKHKSIWAGLRSHFRWLHQMGMLNVNV